MTKFQLSCCDNFLPSTTTTYHHQTLNQSKWNDHFLVSRSLKEGSSLSSHQVLEDGDNLSDHVPIMMKLSAHIRRGISDQNLTTAQPKLKWANISAQQKLNYETRLQHLSMSHPASAAMHACVGKCRCRDQTCQNAIQQEYDFIISALQLADAP